jgi:hypothetical protein
VRTAAEEWLASVRQFAKDFGLSLTLAVLGFLFTVWERQRQNWQRAAEKEREDLKRAAEKEKGAALLEQSVSSTRAATERTT